MRQFIGIFGFLFTNAYLAYRHFKQNNQDLRHIDFKFALSEQMVHFKEAVQLPVTRLSLDRPLTSDPDTHKAIKLAYPTPCYYCRWGYETSSRVITTFACSVCRLPGSDKPVPLHKSTSMRPCWDLHVHNGLPSKKSKKSKK